MREKRKKQNILLRTCVKTKRHSPCHRAKTCLSWTSTCTAVGRHVYTAARARRQRVYVKTCWSVCRRTGRSLLCHHTFKTGRWLIISAASIISWRFSPPGCGPLGPVCRRELLWSPWRSPGWQCSPGVCLCPPRCGGPAPRPAPLAAAPPRWPRPPGWTSAGCCLHGPGSDMEIKWGFGLQKNKKTNK